MRAFSILLYFLFFCAVSSIAQQSSFTVYGQVVDNTSNEPILGVSVYIAGTSVGTSTDLDGKYKIEFNPSFKEPLVFSYVGFKTFVLETPDKASSNNISLTPSTDQLDAVYLNPDPWSRADKESVFRLKFCGETDEDDCIIKNIEDVYLQYNPETQVLVGYASAPIETENLHLGYSIRYDLEVFEIKFRPEFGNPLEKRQNQSFEEKYALKHYKPKVTYIEVKAYYGELPYEVVSEKRRERRREKAFEVSHTYFIRSLISNTLEENGFELSRFPHQMKLKNQITVNILEKSRRVSFREKDYSIQDKNGRRSGILLLGPSIYFDHEGRLLSKDTMLFNGAMVDVGLMGQIPKDYQSKDK